MKVKEVIEKLKEYNPDAIMTVVAHNKDFKFTFAYSSEDCDGDLEFGKHNAEKVSLYVDDLCSNETQFIDDFIKSQEDLDSEFNDIVNNNFSDLIDNE